MLKKVHSNAYRNAYRDAYEEAYIDAFDTIYPAERATADEDEHAAAREAFIEVARTLGKLHAWTAKRAERYADEVAPEWAHDRAHDIAAELADSWADGQAVVHACKVARLVLHAVATRGDLERPLPELPESLEPYPGSTNPVWEGREERRDDEDEDE